MTNLQILSKSIRTFENLYSLNDLHSASGGESKHRPSLFIRLDTTQDLISEIQKEVKSTDLIFKTTGGRGLRGTYACEELALAYAMWISPKFHLIVLRAFLAMHRNEQPKQLALPEPEKKFSFEFTEYELQLLPWLWFIALRGIETCRMIYPAMETLGSKYSGAIYGQTYEYKHTIREAHKLLKRLTADVQYDYESNWRVLKHLNDYNPKSNNYQVI